MGEVCERGQGGRPKATTNKVRDTTSNVATNKQRGATRGSGARFKAEGGKPAT